MSDTKLTPEEYADHVGFDADLRDSIWNLDFVELIAKRLELDRVTRALDVGCGAGHWSRLLLKVMPACKQLVGVDQEPTFVERAKRAGDQRSDFRTGDAYDLPFDDDSFDLVTCQTLLMHLHEPEPPIRQPSAPCGPRIPTACSSGGHAVGSAQASEGDLPSCGAH